MEQTKGYFRLEGKIWGLNNKEPYTNDTKRNLSIGIQSSKTNSNYVQIGDWKNSKLNIKVKTTADGEVEEMNEQDAIQYIKDNFKDGDSVYLNLRADVDKYHNKLNWLVSQIYKKSEAIDFDSEEFEEVNELNQYIVVTEKPTDNTIKVGIANYQGKMIELDLALDDDVVRDYIIEKAKVGDLMHVSILVDNRPVYEDGGASSEATKERTTLKGKKIGGNSGTPKIKERNLVFVLSDIDVDKTVSKKYTREEIREALESSDYTPKSKNENKKDDDEDLPF